jgi:hypothetical protein
MSILRASAVSLILTGFAVACSSSSTSNSGGGIPIDELPAKYAEAVCTAYQNCFGPLLGVFLNGSDCTELTTQRLENGTFAQAKSRIDLGTVSYDGTKAQACLDVMRQLSCDDFLQRDRPECLAALDGTVALGGACDLNEECKGSALCQSKDSVCPGKCVALLSAGQACGVDGDCDDGLQCYKETKLCVKPAASGESCEYGSPPCGPGQLCLGKDDQKQTPGNCYDAKSVLSASEGAVCDPTTGVLCQESGSCVADSLDIAAGVVTWKCVKIGTYKAGEACKPGIPDPCSSGNYCKPLGAGVLALQGTCTAIPDPKQACGTGFGAQCKVGAVCVAGLCENYASNGVACTGDDMCYSEYCGKSGGCEPRLPCR